MESRGLTGDIFDVIALQGYAVAAEALPVEQSKALARECELRYDSGQFASARIGRGLQQMAEDSIRSDRIHWLDAHDSQADIADWFEQIKSWVRAINQNFYLSLNAFECHFACYEPGAFYRRHIDRFQNDDGRRLSLILFLNEGWSKDDGGELIIYHPDVPAQKLATVWPEIGTLVLFQSDRFPHEVMPTKRRRLALTGWLKSIPSHEAALQGTFLS